jgi:hypothetical protein
MTLTRAARHSRLTTATAVACIVGTAWLIALIAPGVVSADLPRTYEVQRVDSPSPLQNGRFALSLTNVGDVNGDGEDDVLTGTDKHGTTLGAGQVNVISGEDGTTLRRYALPDVDPGVPGGGGDRPSGFGSAVAKLADVGSCPGFAGAAGEPCTAATVGPLDAVPEHLVAASGVDVDPATGAPNPALNNSLGIVYVFDGRSGALLKRLLMPAADRAATVAAGVDARYGRTVLSPSGQPPCGGFGGLATTENECPYPPASRAAIGDLDATGADLGDVLVAATDYLETQATAHPESECATQTFVPARPCASAGRVYVYRGEDIAGSDPSIALAANADATTIRSPLAQPDDPAPLSRFSVTEEFGMLLIPVGDAGRCAVTPAPIPGARCGNPGSSTPDGSPEFAVVASSVNLHGFPEVGEALLIDGATLTVIKTTPNPEPRPESAWGLTQNGVVSPAIGDVTPSGGPDFYVPEIQYAGRYTAQGRGLVVDGRPANQGSFREFPVRFEDPTPQTGEQFGASAGGVGNLAGDSRREIIVGAIGPHNPGTNQQVVNDVHIFSPVTGTALQTISAPDQQGGETFGVSLAPLGDLNDDGFLDFAIGAGFYNLPGALSAGRMYLLRSDNSPAPPAQPQPGPPVAGGGAPVVAVAAAGRTIELDASRNVVRSGSRVALRGVVEAFANAAGCQSGQPVDLQVRRSGDPRYTTLAQVRTDSEGNFAATITPRSTALYRARIAQTAACLGAVSNSQTIAVPPAVSAVTTVTRLTAGRVVRLQLLCPRGGLCSGTVKLRTARAVRRPGGARQRITLGTRGFQIPGGRRRTTRLIVSAGTARALRTVRSVPLNVFITSRDANGRAVVSRDRLTLRTR